MALALARSGTFHHTGKQDNEKFPSVRWDSPAGPGGLQPVHVGPRPGPVQHLRPQKQRRAGLGLRR